MATQHKDADIYLKKFALGTAQFGMDYGIANRTGKIPAADAEAILEIARSEGIGLLDTAHSYGDSEEVLGRIMSDRGLSFDVISKLPGIERGDTSRADVYLKESLARLRADRIHGYLVHNFDSARDDDRIFSWLSSVKAKGLISKSGISVYKPEELEHILKNDIDIDIVQFPYNIFDQRFEELLPELKARKIEAHARSVFLQGAFFAGEEILDGKLSSARKAMENVRDISKESAVPVNALCICFAMSNKHIDKVIIGVDSSRQLRQNLDALSYIRKVAGMRGQLKQLKLHEDKVILPYNWK